MTPPKGRGGRRAGDRQQRPRGGGNTRPSQPTRPKAEPQRPTVDVHDPDGVRLQKLLAAAGVGLAPRLREPHHPGPGRGRRPGRHRARGADPTRHRWSTSTASGCSSTSRGSTSPSTSRSNVVTSMSDELGRVDIGDYVGDRKERLFHVGRLDADTEGLLLLTNDGDLAHRLQHPRYGVLKTYLAQVPGPRAARPRPAAAGGRRARGRTGRPSTRSGVVDSQPGKALVEVVLHEGRKHIVRRLLAEVGHPVISLVRTQVGPVRLGDTKPGRWRALTAAEVGGALRGGRAVTRVHVVGTGLIGTSLGLRAARAHGDEVDPRGRHRHPRGAGAGPRRRPARRTRATPRPTSSSSRPRPTSRPAASPTPCERFPEAVVTDVASVKGAVVAGAARRGADLARYCGSHPMAGPGAVRGGVGPARPLRRSGLGADPDARDGPRGRAALVAEVARAAGAAVRELPPDGARPRRRGGLARAAAGGQPRRRAARGPRRAGGGARRAGAARRHPDRGERPGPVDPDPRRQRRGGPRRAARASPPTSTPSSTRWRRSRAGADAPGARARWHGPSPRATPGHARIPGKHGAAPTAYATVRVLVPDRAGAARPALRGHRRRSAPTSRTSASTTDSASRSASPRSTSCPAAAAALAEALAERGWQIHG